MNATYSLLVNGGYVAVESWLSGLLGSGVGAGVAATALQFWKNAGITEAQLNERITFLKEELKRGQDLQTKGDEEFKANLKETINEIRAVVLTVARLQSSQDEINVVTTKALDSLVKKAEEHGHKIVELTTTQSLMREMLDLLKDHRKNQ